MMKRIAGILLAIGLLSSCRGFNPTGDFSEIRGRVYSLHYHAPLAQATVSVPSQNVSVKTDAQGYFSLPHLPTQKMELLVESQHHMTLKRWVRVEPYGAKYIELWQDQNTAGPQEIVFERDFDLWSTDIYGIKQVNLTGGQNRRLYRTYPSWSSDKKQVAFIGYDGSRQMLTDDGIWVMKADGSMPQKLMTINETGRFYRLDWALDGSQFVFMLQNRMYVYNKAAGTTRGVSSLLSREGQFETYDISPSWTPDGRQIAFTAHHFDLSINTRSLPNTRQVFMLDYISGQTKQLTFASENYAPAVSHDGKRIAYVSLQSGNPELWVMDIDGNNPKQLTFFKSKRMGHLNWMPDNQHIVFNSDYMQQYPSNVPKETWVIDRDGSKAHMISNDALHPDG